MHNLWQNVEIPAGRPVVIACPGPGALEGIQRIPEDAYIIACNYGVCLPLPRVDEWLVLDENCRHADWWERAHSAALRYAAWFVWSHELADQVSIETDGGMAYTARGDAENRITTQQGSALSYADPFPQFGTLRGNATVAGGAAQRAFWGLRASHLEPELPPLYWLGVPMAGGGYWDSTEDVYSRPHNWPYVATLNALVRVLASAGMRSVALTPTAIEMEAGY